MVAKAKDFSFCKATMKQFQPWRNGDSTGEISSTSEVRQCKTPVDLRRGEYCDFHRQQRNKQSSSSNVKAKSGTGNAMSKLRCEPVLVPYRRTGTHHQRLEGNRFLAPSTATRGNAATMSVNGCNDPPQRKSLASFIKGPTCNTKPTTIPRPVQKEGSNPASITHTPARPNPYSRCTQNSSKKASTTVSYTHLTLPTKA